MAETIRQAARRQVKEAAATRQRSWAEREDRLGEAAVDIVAAIAARDRAERAAAKSIEAMLALQVTLTEVGERCGLPVKEVARLKRCYLEAPPAELTVPVGQVALAADGVRSDQGPRS
jgi:cyanate lyase